MTTPQNTVWHLDPHTVAKHEILRRYLSAWFPILSSFSQRVVYLDGFCGPGRYSGGEPGSPVIALQEALKHKSRLADKSITFVFMDERSDRIDSLQQEVTQINLPSNFNIYIGKGLFEVELAAILDKLEENRRRLAPTFAFVDPFGFKGIPFDLIRRLLKNERTEVFINFMADSINRFVEHPNEQVRQHITALFGSSQATEIATLSENRILDLRDLYQAQLSTCARFVRYFEMKNVQNRTIYYLFFASNHPLGHLKMKEAFWKADPNSGFQFSDATDRDQLVLFEYDESPKLASELHGAFQSRTVQVAELEDFTFDKTAYVRTHLTSALKELEADNRISVKLIKADGKKRRANTFPRDVIVMFTPR